MTQAVEKGLKRIGITISKPILALICIVFGILVIVFEDLLQWIVGLFLLIQGILLLTDLLEYESQRTPMTVSKGFYCTNCGTRNIEEAVYCKKCGETLKQVKQKKA